MNKGYLNKAESGPIFDPLEFKNIIQSVRDTIYIVFDKSEKKFGIATESEKVSEQKSDSFSLAGILPPLYPEWLGDRSFQEVHNLRFAYVGGAMARGIASAEMVIAFAKSGMLGFFGSAGLAPEQIEREITKIKNELDPQGYSWGANLIHSPDHPELEAKITDIFLKLGVKRISAAAFMNISENLVYYACKGLSRDNSGAIRRENHIFGKISRPEVAKHFLSPPPDNIINRLLEKGKITSEQAQIAKKIPLAEDIVTEGDSGGHTDNRPLNVLFPIISDLREKLSKKYGYKRNIRIGAAGGLGTPQAVAAAFAMGASFVLLGSVHQSCVESGLSEDGKKLLMNADMADVMMTPSADMFELGGKVQVLKKGTFMGLRGNQLHELYARYDSIEKIPVETKKRIEQTVFRMSFDDIWEETKKFFAKIDPGQIEKAKSEPKYKMALIFRWYLGNSSKWAILGDKERKADYQIWCGPAIGSFNTWVKGSFLENPEKRTVRQTALNLMQGAAIVTRVHQLRTYGVPVLNNSFSYEPVHLEIT